MIRPSEFLTQAELLVQGPSVEEVNLRSAVSRAYYSLYHESLETLKLKRKQRLVNRICQDIVSRNVTLDQAKVQAFDKDYLSKEAKVNLHKIISKVLRDDRATYQLGSEFADFRFKRDFADYDIEKDPKVDFTKQIVPEIKDLILQIKRM